MKLTEQNVAQVKFRARGKWYDGKQVDAFLDELSVAIEQACRELHEVRGTAQLLTEQVEALRHENERLEEQRKHEPENPLQELEQERAQLIADIQALREFRDRFREAMEQDVAELQEKVVRLSSDELLE